MEKIDTDTEFAAACNLRGFNFSTAFFWANCPDVFGASILQQAKRLARFLKKAQPDLKHAAALDAVAKALKFQHWHELHKLAKQLIDDFTPSERGQRRGDAASRCLPLASALDILIQIHGDLAPTRAEKARLEELMVGLQAQGISHDVCELVLAQINDADSWAQLIERSPLNSSLPLYEFEVGNDGKGIFRWSAGCATLVEAQDALFQGFSDRSIDEQSKCVEWITRTVDAREDFLEGQLALGSILEESPEPKHFELAGVVYQDAVAKAMALIPRGFKGDISWYDLENRFFHRLLFACMKWAAWDGKLGLAARLARKQLMWNKGDNLGVRYLLPIFVVANGRAATASQVARLRKNASNYDPQGFLTLSIVAFASGNVSEARHWLVKCLFAWPALRHLIKLVASNGKEDGWYSTGRSESRAATPDVEACYVSINVAFTHVSGLVSAYNHWLDESTVQIAEANLKTAWHRRTPQDGVRAWSERCEELGARFSP